MLVPIERAQSNMLLKAAVKYHCADLLGLFYPDFPWDVLPLPVSPFFPHVRSRTFISLHVWWCSTCFEQKLWWRFRRWRKTVINLTQNTYKFQKDDQFWREKLRNLQIICKTLIGFPFLFVANYEFQLDKAKILKKCNKQLPSIYCMYCLFHLLNILLWPTKIS